MFQEFLQYLGTQDARFTVYGGYSRFSCRFMLSEAL